MASDRSRGLTLWPRSLAPSRSARLAACCGTPFHAHPRPSKVILSAQMSIPEGVGISFRRGPLGAVPMSASSHVWKAPGWQGFFPATSNGPVDAVHATTGHNALGERGRFFVTLTLSHNHPRHSGDLVGDQDGRHVQRSRQQRCEPRSMPGAVDFGIAPTHRS
jgi:hypothetical protein